MIKLRMDNFLSFAIVSGFFIGLLLSSLKFDEAEMIIAGTFISTMGFYLITLVSASFFIRFFNYEEKKTRKPSYNHILEEYIEEFDRREKMTNRIRGFLRTMERTMQEEEMLEQQQEATKKQTSKENNNA